MNILSGRTVLVTGGAGSWGTAFAKRVLSDTIGPKKLIVYSRDEAKHARLKETVRDDRLRTFLGDVRDRERLVLACRGVDIIIHAAALKVVPAGEYDPGEFIHTNVLGSENVIHAALEAKAQRCLLLGTDKGSAPSTLYGATKLCAERMFSAANAYSGGGLPRFAATRYGNVLESTQSVVPVFKACVSRQEPLPITDPQMTRFLMTMDQAVDFVLLALSRMHGGEVFVPKLPSVFVWAIAEAVAGPGYPHLNIGARAAEKWHESLISRDESPLARDYGDHYRILPTHAWREQDLSGKLMPSGSAYASDTNDRWMSVTEIRALISRDTREEVPACPA